MIWRWRIFFSAALLALRLCAGTVSGGCILELGTTHGHQHFPWLKAGDVVTVEIERIGSMTNTLRRGVQPIPLEPREDKQSTP